MLSAGDAVAVVQAGYRLEGTLADWLRGVGAEFRTALRTKSSVSISRFETRDDALVLDTGLIERQTHIAWSATAATAWRASPLLTLVCASAPGLWLATGHAVMEPELRWLTGGLTGSGDWIALVVEDEPGCGWLFCASIARAPRVTAQHDARWADVAAQLGAAARLRRALVMHARAAVTRSTRGDAFPELPGERARAELRAAARRCLGSPASDDQSNSEDARQVWTAIADGDWSIVDRHEFEERCVIVAHRNESASRDPRAFTALERQVGQLAASGLSGKRIAYELGLSTPTVSQLLHRAARKLGVRGVAQLSRTIRALDAPRGAAKGMQAAHELEVRELLIAGAHLVALSFPWLPAEPLAFLSAAEREVLRCVLRGDSNAEVAARRRTAVRTTANQVASIFRKVGVSSRSELLARLAI